MALSFFLVYVLFFRPVNTEISNKQKSPRLRAFLLGSNFVYYLWRGERDDVRTYMRKAERAAALIYAHFKKEFGIPDKRP